MTLVETPQQALDRAVEAAGSQSAFARIIGRRQSTVRFWLVNDRPLPAEHVLPVERETGVSRHLLRPDLYPKNEVGADEAPNHFDRSPQMKRTAA